MPAIRRLFLLVVLVAIALPSVADARRGKRRRGKAKAVPVKIVTNPKGAVVTTDTGAILGRTPVRARLPRGTHILTIKKDGYEPFEYAIEVRRKRHRFKFRLEEKTAIEILLTDESSHIEGASVVIDGEQVGTAPGLFEVPSGAHQIQVRKKGYVAHEEYVEASGVTSVIAHLESETVGGPPPETEDDAPIVAKKKRASKSVSRTGTALVVVGGGLELGGRRFRYENPQTAKMRDFDAGGVPMIRLTADVFPLTNNPSKLLAGLGVAATFARGAPVNSNTSDGKTVGTGFGDMELGVRLRVPLGRPTLAGEGWDVGGKLSYGKQFFSFDEMNPLATEVPGVNYSFIGVGFDVGSSFDRHRAFASGGYRVVNSTGTLGTRFATDEASGLDLRAGISTMFGPKLELRVLGSLSHYGHSFRYDEAAEFMADGASDSFFGLMVGGMYVY